MCVCTGLTAASVPSTVVIVSTWKRSPLKAFGWDTRVVSKNHCIKQLHAGIYLAEQLLSRQAGHYQDTSAIFEAISVE